MFLPHMSDVIPFFAKIELKAEDLYDKEKVDLETIVIDDVFTLLQCSDKGLDTEEATRRLELFGPNRLEQEEQNAFLQVSPEGFATPAFQLIVAVAVSSSVSCGIPFPGSWRWPLS
jgi:H+-transporting ATPase